MKSAPICCRGLCIAALAFISGAVQGEEAQQPEVQLETVVVVGTRAAPRTATDAPVPVDAIDAEALMGQGSGDMSNLLRTTIPSFHVSTNPSRDAAALLRPVNLRGLAPDHTLVLVNNKRRHRGAVIQWISNGASDGAQGPDISAIPAVAVERVEVLRDGAAAQYGSDAIAGVVNFVLKDDDEGGSIEAKYGFHTADTAEDLTVISGNVGMGLGTAGFANFSVEYTTSASTDRSVQHPDAVAMEAVGVSVANPAKTWGDAEVNGGLKAFVNTGLEFDNGVRAYAFGNYTTRDVTTAFFYRSPQGRSGVYVSGGKILIGGGPACKARYDYAATPENVVTVRDLLLADEACFAFAEILPEGFTPAFGASMTDMSAVGGFAGSLENGLTYDVSVSHGRNHLDFFIHETVNASYGPATPRSFDIGANQQTETNFNVDVTYAMDVGLASDLNVAAGFEWRDEGFKIVMGEPLSWDTGPFGADGFSARSNGFGGFNPASAGKWDRANIAGYIDLEADVNDCLRLGGALRWEDFDDFGSVINYKVAGRLQATDLLAFRASIGSGFRAPTPGQQNANNLSTVVDSATGVFREQGTVASTNPVALALGGAPLDAESSNNFTLGFLVQTDRGLDLTVDLFRIDLHDRIALSDNLNVTDALRAELTAAGVAAAADFNRIRYFTNDYDTRTTGLDIVLTQRFDTDLGVTNLLAGFNRTMTSIEELEQASTASRVASIERGSPGSRVSLAVSHATGSWDLGARLNYFGSWFDSDDNHYHDGYQYLDVSAKYSFGENIAVIIGSDNVLDAYPDEAVRSPSSGRLYPRYSPAGYNGRLMYGRLRYAF